MADHASALDLRTLLRNAFERRIVAAFAFVLLAVWSVACITDFNHPPGNRYVRVLSILLVALIGRTELRRPWWGVSLFLLFWPQSLAIRELLALHVSPLFAGMPEFWGGPVACALTLAILARHHAERPLLPRIDAPPVWLTLFRGALWILFGAYTLAAIANFLRLSSPPPDWGVPIASWRDFLAPGISRIRPLAAVTQLMPPVLLGLALLNVLADKPGAIRPPLLRLLAILSFTGVLAAVQLFIQIKQGSCGYSFTGGWRPAGPFEHRNTAGPLFALIFALALVAAFVAKRRAQPLAMLLFLGSGLVLLVAAYLTTSRNALLILLAMPWLALFIRPSAPRFFVGVLAPAIVAAMVFYAPLPKADQGSDSAFSRLLISIEYARSGDLNGVSGERMPLFKTALNMGSAYPLTGTGVGTFPLLARPDSPFRAPGQVDAYGAAHSMPLHLFAECGALAALAWIAIYLLIPSLLLVRAKSGGAFGVILLAFGIGNVTDTMWMISGVTTFSVLILFLAAFESSGGTFERSETAAA